MINLPTLCFVNKADKPIRLWAVILATLAFILGGCSSQQKLSEQSALQSFPEVAALQDRIASANVANVQLLAPGRYKEATGNLTRAMTLAQANDPKADNFARQGLAAITAAESDAARANDVFEEVMKYRQRAVEAGAPQYSPDAFNKAENSLLALTTLLENGNDARAKAGRAGVMKQYANVELATLKGSTIDRAKEAIVRAKKMRVDDYAPKTFQLAEEEMQLANDVLDADRSSTEKAERHSQSALYHARRATEIAEVIKNFRASDYEEEDIVLWYQEQLSRTVAPVNPALGFDIPNKEVVKGVASQLVDLTTENADLATQLNEKDATIVALTSENESTLLKTKAETEQERLNNEAIAARFAKIQTMFTKEEADVYRQIDNVLIRAHGFEFASGKSNIDAENFSMLNRITSAIGQFPKSQIMVSGHTDSQGNDAKNMTLSQNRADNVAKFLIEVGNIPADRIVAEGFGEDKPVANNESEAGRAANRRVEVLIDNSAGL